LRVFGLSDMHIDYSENRLWLSNLSASDFKQDVLILAGDLTEDLVLLEASLTGLSEKFAQVLFVPGNHELWVRKYPDIDSLEKFKLIKELTARSGVSMAPYHAGPLSIVPLLSWYDFSFGQPSEKIMANWVDFRACRWPGDMDENDITQYFLDLNCELDTVNQTVISFSHFMPRIDLMPNYIPETFSYLHPVMGSNLLECQVRKINPDIHLYGHSHVNVQVVLDKTEYINNAFGYPSETRITKKQLRCIYSD